MKLWQWLNLNYEPENSEPDTPSEQAADESQNIQDVSLEEPAPLAETAPPAKTAPQTSTAFFPEEQEHKQRTRQRLKRICFPLIVTVLILLNGTTLGTTIKPQIFLGLFLWLTALRPDDSFVYRRTAKAFGRVCKKRGAILEKQPPSLTKPFFELPPLQEDSQLSLSWLETTRKKYLSHAQLLIARGTWQTYGLLGSCLLFAVFEEKILFYPSHLVLIWAVRRFFDRFAMLSVSTKTKRAFLRKTNRAETIFFRSILTALAAMAAALWCGEWSGLDACGLSASLLVLLLSVLWDRLPQQAIFRGWMFLPSAGYLAFLYFFFTSPQALTIFALGSLPPLMILFCVVLSLFPIFAGE